MFKRIVIGGSTGHLGQALLEIGLERGFELRALARHPEKLEHFKNNDKIEILNVDVTHPNELKGICDGFDAVITTLGITRQKDKVSYMDIDYQANLNLLMEGKSAKIKNFMYASGFGIEDNLDIALYKAKYEFELALIKSDVPYVIVRPNGFFSDILEFFEMAKKGRIYLFGNGNGNMNPIHTLDLAEFFYDHINDVNTILSVGGPDIFEINKISELAFKVLEKPPRITHLPSIVVKLMLGLLRLYSFKHYTAFKFMSRFMNRDMIAPVHGHRHLEDTFKAHI